MSHYKFGVPDPEPPPAPVQMADYYIVYRSQGGSGYPCVVIVTSPPIRGIKQIKGIEKLINESNGGNMQSTILSWQKFEE